MAEVAYTERAVADLERLAEFLAPESPRAAREAMATIRDGIDVLKRHPIMGRSCESGLRELVISFGKRGYVALYDFDEGRQSVLVLAVRHQREAGFGR